MKDEFRYLMEDVNESSSEERIRVDGIVDYANSPHEINKKAYDLKLTKMSDNNYISRLGFNMYKLPKGDYYHLRRVFSCRCTNHICQRCLFNRKR